MQSAWRLAVLLLLLACANASASQARRASRPQVAKVIAQIEEFKAKIEGDAKAEQESYTKFSCWCEDSLSLKAKEISELKKAIQDLTQEIMKLKGKVGSDGVEIEQLQKDIAENEESTKEAKAIREKEAEAYASEKIESEQCIGALEAAINALSGAGQGKGKKEKKELETIQQTQLLSTVGSLRNLLTHESVSKVVGEKDLELVREFVDHPSKFMQAASQRGASSFLETTDRLNPFGNYAPRSGQIQGILQGMYDAFNLELEKANAEEGKKQKAHEELIGAKEEELASFQGELEKFEAEHGDAVQTLATASLERDTNKKALEENEAFFDMATADCQEKAAAWATRSSLRSGELAAIQKALDILQSPEAQELFSSGDVPSGDESFLQLAAAPHPSLLKTRHRNQALVTRDRAYERLAKLAKTYGTLSLARVAAEVRLSGGHFDKVITLIDNLVAELEEDAKDDVAQKEFCESETAKNKASKKDLEKSMKKMNKTIAARDDQIQELDEEVSELDDKMNSTRTELKEMSETKAEETSQFEQERLENLLAIKALNAAKAAIQEFYEANGLMELQTSAAEGPAAAPAAGRESKEVAIAVVKAAPETSFDKAYTAEQAVGAKGIIQILDMLIDSIKKDMDLAQTQEDTSMKKFDMTRTKMKDVIEADQDARDAKHKDMAVHETKQANQQADLQQAAIDKDGVEKVLESLAEKCAWVDTHFESRLAKRQAEIDGLKEAKHILLGAAQNYEVFPPTEAK